MAIVIEHGPNGSYKTASVVWFRIIPALREGRVVVTNVLGLYPIEEIEERLGEKFPDSARLFRILLLLTIPAIGGGVGFIDAHRRIGCY